MALPVFSVHTMHDAERLQVLSCRLTRAKPERYVINYESGFVHGDMDTMDLAAAYLRERYDLMLRRRIFT